MNADLFRGKWDVFKGELKQEWGKFTEDDLLSVRGDYDNFMALAQERYPGRQVEIRRWTDEWYNVVQFPAPPTDPPLIS